MTLTDEELSHRLPLQAHKAASNRCPAILMHKYCDKQMYK